MGYTIYYSRAFIRVGEQYIPLVNSGASNVSEWVNGRMVSEKDWGVLNWQRRGQILFSESGIHDIAKDYERLNQESGMCYKSRNKPFVHGKFEAWIVGGMKLAYTIEEYGSAGNIINVVDYPNGMAERWRCQPFSSDEELFSLIKQLGIGRDIDISFSGREITRPTARRAHDRGNEMAHTGNYSADSRPNQPSVLKQISAAREQSAASDKPKRDKPRKSHGEEI